MTPVRRALSLLLILSVFGAPAARGGPSEGFCVSPQKVYSFTVETTWSKKTYRVGEKAKVKVLVTRPGPNDPANMGTPMPDGTPHEPVEGAYVTSFINGVYPSVGAIGETDAEGRVTIRFEIADHLSGPQNVYTRASIMRRSGVPSDCTDVEEEGAKTDSPAFTVR
jgi:hypothetical protein